MEFKKLVYKSPVGYVCCLFDGRSLLELSIKDSNELSVMSDEFKYASLSSTHYSLLVTHHCYKELDAYFRGDLKKFRQKIKFVRGTDFEQKVWLALKGIPYGETRSYKWLAERIGKTEAVRAVGQALKKNPLPIILPCHRVIASDGSLGGFSCGVDVKKWLLRHEGAI